MALIVLDASVVIALLDADDEHHQAAVAALQETRGQERVLPASAYAEALVAPMRRGSEHAAKVDQALAALAIRVQPLTPDIARSAASLRARSKAVRLPDAIVVATGEVLGARRVVTAARRWRKLGVRVRII